MLTSGTGPQLHGSASFVNNSSVVPGHNSTGHHSVSNLLGKNSRSSSEPPTAGFTQPAMKSSNSTSSFQQKSTFPVFMKPLMIPKVEKVKTNAAGTEA